MTTRTLAQVIESMPTSDGAGVKLRRSLGSAQNLRLDPFLMLDEFSSDNADDYIAGFPNHPHRGFETVTYMLDGHMLHQDHMGNRGDLKSGDVQWMTAGRGIIHSEMPQQESGRMRGFQLWINLPAKEKMKPAGYRDIPAGQIPAVQLSGGGRVRVIAGTLEADGRSTAGPCRASAPSRSTSTWNCPRAGVRAPGAVRPQRLPLRLRRERRGRSRRLDSRAQDAQRGRACCR
jgi:redox-sensitive bicupin YhaK (pirin superfamily)